MPFNFDPNASKNLSVPEGNASLAVISNQQKTSTPIGSSIGRDLEGIAGVNAFWVQPTIDPNQWNQYFPYQLIVVKTGETGGYTQHEDWPPFTLPIPPQEMTISMPAAISTSVTMGGGIVEEHNGAPFRTISLQGTMGVQPLRTSNSSLATQGLTGGIFGGTIRAANGVVKIAKSVVSGSTAQGNTKLMDPQYAGLASGYQQIHLLRRFLESYLQAKTTDKGKDLRLAFAIWKDRTIYLVTPIEFTARRSASSPVEYLYSLSFKAWKRIALQPGYEDLDLSGKFELRTPSAFNQVLNRLSNARRTIASLKDVIAGISQDTDRIFETMREVSFALKELAGVAQATIDLPQNIFQDAEQSWQALANSPKSFASLDYRKLREFRERFSSYDHKHAVTVIGQAASTSMKATIGSGDAPTTAADPIKKILRNPYKAYSLFEQVKVSDLRLPPVLLKKVIAERVRVRAFTRSDFEQRRDLIVKAAADIGDSVGAGDVSYNAVYGRGNTISTKIPTDDHYDLLYALNEIGIVLNYLSASAKIKSTPSALAYVAGLAAQSGIPFVVPNSKYAVPFPYGFNLERMATQYLGTPDRWHEIATLNGLQAPYIDEEGFDLLLVSDGRTNQVTVSDATKLYVGQSVWLSASNTTRTNRHIRTIEKVSSYFLLTLDGDSDLDRFVTTSGAVLHAFLPNTVNSQMTLFIPSTKAANESYFSSKSIPGLNIFDNLIKVGGVDLLLTPTGDLAITPDGDCRLAVGLTNIVQHIRTVIGTRQGSLMHHQSFGLPLQPGVNTADMSAADIASSISNLFKGDPAISGVQSVQVNKAGPVANVTVSVSIVGSNQIIPVTVQIQR